MAFETGRWQLPSCECIQHISGAIYVTYLQQEDVFVYLFGQNLGTYSGPWFSIIFLDTNMCVCAHAHTSQLKKIGNSFLSFCDNLLYFMFLDVALLVDFYFKERQQACRHLCQGKTVVNRSVGTFIRGLPHPFFTVIELIEETWKPKLDTVFKLSLNACD